MNNRIILVISELEFDTQQIALYIKENNAGDFKVLQKNSIEGLEELFLNLDEPIHLVIGDVQVPGVVDFLAMLKEDELFSFLPMILILPRYEPEKMAAYFAAGIESYILKKNLNKLLLRQILPLINFNSKFISVRHELNFYHEKGIHDYILLGLIKDYIPRTLWNMADKFAEQQKIVLPEEMVDLTVTFGDIKGFSTFSQYRQPREVIELINAGFDVITHYVYELNGDIDKFIGDAFVGVFDSPKDAMLAMYLAQQDLGKLNDRRKAEGLQEIIFRIGINYGPVIRGNVGGNSRYDNTLIGDTINTAARLESIANPRGITISQSIVDFLNVKIPEEYRRYVQLKGRSGEDAVYNAFDYFKKNPQDLPGLSDFLATHKLKIDDSGQLAEKVPQ